MNPSVDISTSADHIAADRKLRCEAPRYEPGGGGINISAALQELGRASTAVFPCGGPPGTMLLDLLDNRGIRHRAVETDVWTRMNIAAFDRSTSTQYRFVMPGPRMDSTVSEACMKILREMEPRPDYIAVSGSFPPGISPDFIKDLKSTAAECNARLLADTSAEPLKEAARSGIYLIKPNMRELKEIVPDRDVSSEAGQEEALRFLIEEYGCRTVILSLGAAGVLLGTPDMMERLRAPAVPISSRVGAGDSMAAGILFGLSRNYDIRRAVILGIAAGSAAVMTPGTELCRREDVERLFEKMEEYSIS